MRGRSAPALFALFAVVGLTTGVGACGPDVLVRVADAGRSPSPGTSSSGGTSGSASHAGGDLAGATGNSNTGAAGEAGSQSKSGGSSARGGASTSSSARGGEGARGPDAGSAGAVSTGRVPDASVDTPGGEAGALACNDKTSNGRLGVYYYTGSPNASTQDVSIHLALVNFTALTARLSQATMRYWFTDEGAGTPNILAMYYTPSTLAKITTRFLPATPPRAGADTVLEFSFTPHPDAGVSFVETTEFNFAFHKDGYAGTYNQANDFSFDASLAKSFGPNPKITAYIAGELAWGCEPPVATPDGGRD